MSDVPWNIVIYMIIALSFMLVGWYISEGDLLFLGCGMIAGIGVGTVEYDVWLKRMNDKYGNK